MGKRAFGDLEQSIINILQSGKRMSVRQVQDRLGGDDKYTTIMTVMARLAEKKTLSRERVGLRYEYWLPQEQETQTSLFERIRARLFGVKTVEMVSYLIDEADDLSEDDLDKMEALITAAKKKRSKTDE